MSQNFNCRQRFASLFALLVMVLSLGCFAHAQTAGAGTISGTVTDPSHAVVAGAAVNILNIDTGAAHAYSTNSEGIYVAPFLQPGHYQVEASAAGFGKVHATNLVLLVGQTITIDLTLTVQSETSSVEVTSETPLLDTERTEVSQVVDQQVIQNLPVNGRNWSDFVLLTPNTVQDGGSGLVSFHGISGLYNQNYVDGANNNQMLFSEARGRSSGAPFVYSLDAIKEFQAEAATYSAEFGQAAGGQVNAITKNGTNTLHGDLFYYLRYPTLNALDPVSKYTAQHTTNAAAGKFLLTQPVHQQQEFGGSVGGPIKRDKLFFFLTSDIFRRAGRALYYDTDNVSLTPAGKYADSTNITPTQCPATVSQAQCTAAINFLLGLQSAPSRFAKETLVFPRIDYQLNEKNLIYANFNWADFDQTNGYSSNPTFSNTSASTNGPTSYHERFLVAHWTSTLTSTAVNDLRFQWGRDLETAGANAPAPSISMGAETYGMPNALPRIAEPDENRYQITDVFNKVIGRHTFKFGGDFNLVHEIMINLYQGGGLYTYSGSDTQKFQNWIVDAFAGQSGNTDPYAGSHYNSFTQTIDQVNPLSKAGADDFWMKMYDGFAEDSWKISNKFTVDLGVRYDVQTTPSPVIPNKSTALAAKYNTTIKNVLDRVQPRVGFSWAPYNGTVVRGGYGVFTGLNQGSTYYAMRVENGEYQINYSFSGCNASCTSSNAPALKFPNVPFPVTGPSLSGALHPVGGDVPTVTQLSVKGSAGFHGLDPNFVPPLTHEFDLGVEQALPGKMSLSLGYVGSRALHLPVFLDANLVGQTPHGIRSYLVTDNAGNQRLMTVPYYLATDRIDPTLTSLNAGFSVVNSWYHSMAVTIRRPFANGLELLVNHTWAKALDDDQVQGAYGTFYGGNPVLDPNNLKLEYGRSDLDMRNRFVGTILYKPSILKNNLWARQGIDGFTFSGTATESTGFPIVAGMNTPGSILKSTPSAADGNIYGGAISSGSGFATTGRPPQIQRNSLAGPGVRNIDFRVTRDVPIHERLTMQFIAEAFNLMNHEIVSGVNSTYSTLIYPTTGAGTACPSTTSVPSGSQFAGCINPFTTSNPAAAFGVPNNTSSTIYGPRQLQFSAKILF